MTDNGEVLFPHNFHSRSVQLQEGPNQIAASAAAASCFSGKSKANYLGWIACKKMYGKISLMWWDNLSFNVLMNTFSG